MARLLVHVEGQTEETFVKEVLREHLVSKGYHSVDARIVGNARQRRRRGGIRSWPSVRKDIIHHLKQDAGCIATTMVDYNGLPETGEGAWPGRVNTTGLETVAKARIVQDALRDDVAGEMGGQFDRRRFLPFVVMHEFEGLLFSDCGAFSRGISQTKLKPRLSEIRAQSDSPEDINDSPDGAPSKRIGDLVPDYQKPLHGNLAALEIGLDSIRSECAQFRGWLEQLESIIQLK